jgi:peptidoglycan hydrolase-like protein with peptidoglycan-binding domain
LQEDSDARSGRISDIHVPTSGGSGAPAFPGSVPYQYGDWNDGIKQFQDQMHSRGYFPPGTGQFGPLTLAMVKRLQLLNGLPVTGLLGPLTWALAWTGRYSLPSTSSGGAPAFPGSRSYHYGDSSPYLKQFQDQMNRRGFLPPGTGYFGPLTLAAVKRLQALNGLPVTGYLGPLTWQDAWTGRYWYDTSPSSVPAFPGSGTYHYGDWNNVIKAFQNQMHARGYFPVGTGQYGPLTLAMTKQLQRLNGLPATGELGPNTWALAWTGRYQQP